jgi:hypothetical protein
MKAMDTQTAVNGNKQSVFRREVALIPGWAFVLAALIFVCVPVLFITVLWREEPPGPGVFFRFLVPLMLASFLACYTLMIGYVNRDARRRGMSRTLWTLIVIFVPNAIGFILYFILRNPIRTQCPSCGGAVELKDNYCPHCRYNFHPTCAQCKASVRPEDTFCPNCGAQLKMGA